MRVPGYSGVGDVAQTAGAPTPFRSGEGGTPDAFGASVGEGLQRLAAGGEKFADTVSQHAIEWQNLKNDTEARDADVKGMEQIGQLTATYGALQGKDAVDAYPKYIQDVQKVRTDLSAAMSNPTSKKMFDDVFVRRVGYAINSGAEHSATQQKAYAIGTSNARVALQQQSAAVNYNDDEYFNHSLGMIKNEADFRAKQAGMSPEATALEEQKDVSTAWGLRLQQMAMTDPQRATKLLNDNRASLTPEAAEATGKYIHTQLVNVGSRQIAAEIVASPGSGSYADLTGRQENGGRYDLGTGNGGGKYQFQPGTWKALDRQHPDLGLGQSVSADPAKQEAAFKALTADNAESLRAENLPVSDKNLRMLHFLGATGGTHFLRDLQAVPDGDAVAANPAAAKANPSVFYNPDGSHRTFQEVYAAQTRKYSGGESALSAGTTTGQLDSLLRQGADSAEAVAPGDEQLADAVTTRIKAQFNTIKAGQADQEKADFNAVQDAVTGNPQTGAAPVKDVNDLLGTPELARAWNGLDPGHRKAMLDAIAKNAKGEAVQMTEPRRQRYLELMGEADNDPAKFLKEAVVSEDLPKEQINALVQRQRQVQAGAAKSPSEQSVNRAAKYAADQAGFAKDDPQYNVFTAAVSDAAKQYQEQNKKPMDPVMLANTASSLLREHVVGSGWFGSSFGQATQRAFEVPEEAAAGIKRAFARQGVEDPTPLQIYQTYHSRRPNG